MKNSNLGKIVKFEKWIILVVTTIAIYGAVIGTVNFIRSPKIGYINTNVLLEKYKGAIEAREKIKKQTEEWQNNIRTLETELNQLNQEILDKNDEWDKETRELKQEAFAKKQNDLLRYRRAVSEKAVGLERELMQPVFDELNAYMNDFGRERGYNMIFGTVAGGNILFAKEADDLTDEFLAYVNGKK